MLKAELFRGRRTATSALIVVSLFFFATLILVSECMDKTS